MAPLQYMRQWTGFLFFSLWSLFLALLFALKGTLHLNALKLLDTTGVGVLDTWGFIRQLGVAISFVERFWQFGYSLIWGVQSVGASSSSETNSVLTRVAVVFRSFLQFISATPWLQQLFLCGGSWSGGERRQRAAWRGASHSPRSHNPHEQPVETLPPYKVCPIVWWGISEGGAWEAITVIPSPLDQSCQLKSLDSKWSNYAWFYIALLCIFAFHAAAWSANLYILNFAKDQKDKPTKRWLKDLFSTHLGETCSYRPY